MCLAPFNEQNRQNFFANEIYNLMKMGGGERQQTVKIYMDKY
jgi:hypothetical protein